MGIALLVIAIAVNPLFLGDEECQELIYAIKTSA